MEEKLTFSRKFLLCGQTAVVHSRGARRLSPDRRAGGLLVNCKPSSQEEIVESEGGQLQKTPYTEEGRPASSSHQLLHMPVLGLFSEPR